MAKSIRNHRIEAGFPSPADDYLEEPLDLNDLITDPEATFYTRMEGDALKEAGIFSGDLLVLNRALQPSPGDIVLAIVEDELLARKLINKQGHLYLEYAPGEIRPVQKVEIWGVISTVIRSLR